MKKIVIALVISFGLFGAVAQAADFVRTIHSYQVEVYEGTPESKFGIIRLDSNDTQYVIDVYLHFHRTAETLPDVRITEDQIGRVSAHYMVSDWDEFLSLLDGPGTLQVRWTSSTKSLRIIRTES